MPGGITPPYSYGEITFDANGAVIGADPVLPDGTSDLVVMVHGWLDDADQARSLYGRIAASIAAAGEEVNGFVRRRLAVAGVIWPAKQFDDRDDPPKKRIAALRAFIAADPLANPRSVVALDRARGLVSRLDRDPAARAEFTESVRSLLPAAGAGPDDASDRFLGGDPGDLFDRLAAPPGPYEPPRQPAGRFAGIVDTLLHRDSEAVEQAAIDVLDFATYFLMKARAGTIGAVGIARFLGRITRPGLRIHLVGHSFGARAVSAATAVGEVAVDSVTLLQGAFSQFGFARRWDGVHDGVFRSALRPSRLTGPMLVTHTVNDEVVGVAYAIASRLAGQVASAIGGPGDIYGSIGGNGALATPESVWENLHTVGEPYILHDGVVHNLNADGYIHSHADVTGEQVGYAIASAVETVRRGAAGR